MKKLENRLRFDKVTDSLKVIIFSDTVQLLVGQGGQVNMLLQQHMAAERRISLCALQPISVNPAQRSAPAPAIFWLAPLRFRLRSLALRTKAQAYLREVNAAITFTVSLTMSPLLVQTGILQPGRTKIVVTMHADTFHVSHNMPKCFCDRISAQNPDVVKFLKPLRGGRERKA